MTITDILLKILRDQGPGPHRSMDTEKELLRCCQEAGIPATLEDCKRELRDMAGYP